MYIIRVVDLRWSHLSLTPYEMHCPAPAQSLAPAIAQRQLLQMPLPSLEIRIQILSFQTLSKECLWNYHSIGNTGLLPHPFPAAQPKSCSLWSVQSLFPLGNARPVACSSPCITSAFYFYRQSHILQPRLIGRLLCSNRLCCDWKLGK